MDINIVPIHHIKRGHMSGSTKNKWITCPRPNPQANMRFFCFPYAGGGASVYRDWTTVFSSLEVLPLQFPGRENRLLDPPFTRLDDLVETLAEQMLSFLDRPFAFFGHSMGALV